MALSDIKDSDFDSQILQNKGLTLVDFWAPWCGPCKLAAPVLDELSEAYVGKIQMFKMNVDENQQNPSKYTVLSIPTTVLFKGGVEVGRVVGFRGKQAYEDLIQALVNGGDSSGQ